MKNDLVNNVNKLITKAEYLLKQKSSYNIRRELSELYLSLTMLQNKFNIEPISKTSLEYLMNRIVQNICYEYYFQFYMGFYYLPKKVFDKDAVQLSDGISQANINISCFRCLIHASDMINISLDTSTNTYFFTRGDRITTAIKNFMSHPFDFDVSSMVYLALNYYQALREYENCSDTTYKHHLPELKQEYETLFDLMVKNDTFYDVIKTNNQLLGFWCSVVPNTLMLEYSPSLSSRVFNTRARWILYSYFGIDTDSANKTFEDMYDKVLDQSIESTTDTSLIVRLLCHSLMYKNDIDISDFELFNTQSDDAKCVQYPLSYFFKNYNNLTEQNCTDEDLDKLMQLDDSELRHKVAACMQNVDNNELERQISKPHGALEISDLDIKLFEESQLKYLCMPFKTGREISKSMDESYMYQLIKPFSHFGDNCFVVLITARKCSQGLETYIQRMSVKQPSWRIDVIQHEQLCKLLKANCQI